MKPIPDFPGYYAGDDGSVYSTRQGSPRVLATRLHKGYLHVNVRYGLGRDTCAKMPVHQLICAAFHGHRPTQSHVAAFLDGDPRNVAAVNLQWWTRSDVVCGQKGRGTAVCLRSGQASNAAKLTDTVVRRIRRLVLAGANKSALARSYGITATHVRQIGQGRTRTTA